MSIVMTEDQKVKLKAKFIKTKEIPEEEIDPIEKYQDIKLSFGKWAGTSLKDIQQKDANYIQWLKKRFNEKKEELSPTMKAILKFANAV